MTEVSRPEFWNARYRAGDTGWDKGQVAPPISRILSELGPKRLRVGVLGAGPGHEALAAARAGFQTTAIDFAPLATQAARKAARAARLQVKTLEEDVLRLDQLHPAGFDALLEHTCFCAIDPARRAEYVHAVSGALRSNGVLFGLFYAHGRPGGPPFTTSKSEVRELFGPFFHLRRLRRAADSFPGRAGEELEFIFTKR